MTHDSDWETGTAPDERDTYRQPRLRVVELAVKEVLATGCKTVLGVNSPGSDCTAGTCRDVGSS